MCKLRFVSIALILLGFIYTPLLLADGDFESDSSSNAETDVTTEKSACINALKLKKAECEEAVDDEKVKCNNALEEEQAHCDKIN